MSNTDPATVTYAVSGMSCQHCVDAVTAEVGAIPGVTRVEVDLGAGTVALTSTAPIELDAVRHAVDEAGYEIVDVPPAAS